MTSEEEKWRDERTKVLDQWCEIELKFRDAPPEVRNGTSTEEETMEEKQPDWTEVHYEYNDPLVERIINECYDQEKALMLSSLPRRESNTLNGFVRRCICRPQQLPDCDPIKSEKILLLALTIVPYNDNSLDHWSLLFEFYRSVAAHALEDSALASECPRRGSHWQICIDNPFIKYWNSSADPTTDLRGTGLFGLIQLYSLTHNMQDNLMKTMIQLSRDEPHDFPFAVVGINITSLLVSKLKTEDMDELSSSVGGLLRAMNILYRGCFVDYCKQWKENNCTIKDFQNVFNSQHLMNLVYFIELTTI
uniref:ELMO domain-containing protein n=1 Tax=Heterorhabditis bacteriophora TaxID=37862 RepID=A0A1I7WC73_HETBA